MGMSTSANVLAVILIVVCVGTAIMDFARPPRLVQQMAGLKIPASGLPLLGAIKLLGAAGLIIGFGKIRVGEAAGLGLSLYFAVAVTTHTRVKDSLRDTAPAMVLLLMSVLFVLVTFAK